MRVSLRKAYTRVRAWLSPELLRYCVSGVIVAAVNLLTYHALLWAGVVYAVANITGIVLGKCAGYALNKFWVYQSRTSGVRETLRELLRYIFARGFTGLLDFFGLIFLVEVCGWDEKMSKWIVVGVVLLLNYIFGKKLVFVRKSKSGE